MMRRYVIVLAVFVLVSTTLFSDTVLQKTSQGFEITGYIPNTSGDHPGGAGSPEFYGHLMVRNLYSSQQIIEGGDSIIDIGTGYSLFNASDENLVPLFRVEYVTNYLGPVTLTIEVAPFSDKDGNTIDTYLARTAGITGTNSAMKYLSDELVITYPENKRQWERPNENFTATGGTRFQLEYNGGTVGDNYVMHWTGASEKLESKSMDTFSYKFQSASVTGGDWIQGESHWWWGFYYDWIFDKDSVKVSWNDFGSSAYLPDESMITEYVEYSARVEGEPPQPSGNNRLDYEMKVTVTLQGE